MTAENVDTTELTVQDILDEAGDTAYHSILEIWQEILRPSEKVRKERITPQWAMRVTGKHPQVRFEDMPVYRDLFYDRIDQLNEVLLAEIETDDECLNVTSPEEDVEQNSHHYLNIIVNWQKAILTWELNWDCTHVDAAVDLASLVEVHRMFFDPTGLNALLDQIKFEFTEEHQLYLTEELAALKESWEG